MNNNDILRIAMEQSAIDMNCSVDDFFKNGSTIVESKLNVGVRKCFKNKIFCGFTSYGEGLVASVDEEIKPFIENFLSRHAGFRSFDTPQLIVLNNEFQKYGKCVCFIAEFFLPDLEKEVVINEKIELKILQEEEILSLYSDDRFGMALGYGGDEDKVDVLAVVGYIAGEIVGVAGASNDCETMWQVGIDVLPAYRKMGVATTLTKVLTDEIIKRGKVPYYGTAWSNIASKRNAIKSGYRGAWVEMTAIDEKLAMEMIRENRMR